MLCMSFFRIFTVSFYVLSDYIYCHVLLYLTALLVFQTILTTTLECPPIFSQVWVREPHKQVWAKAFLLLKDKNLYLSYKVRLQSSHLLISQVNSCRSQGDYIRSANNTLAV